MTDGVKMPVDLFAILELLISQQIKTVSADRIRIILDRCCGFRKLLAHGSNDCGNLFRLKKEIGLGAGLPDPIALESPTQLEGEKVLPLCKSLAQTGACLIPS